jgi:hypothetical protein
VNNKIEYNITWLPVKNLSVVWRKSQRKFQEPWAKEIAERFDPDLFEPVVVTKPNGAGIYHVIEGQHRKTAIEMLYGPNETVPCKIVAEADPARAAKIFRGINKGRKGVRPISDFLVAVEAKEDLECAIMDIVKKNGYRIIEGGKGDNCVSAVGALRKVYQTYGEKVLSDTLVTTRLLWGTDPHGVGSSIICGLAMFINEFNGQIEGGHLCKVVQGQYNSPWKFVEAAQAAKDRSSEPMDIAMSNLIRMKYNHGRAEHKRLKRREAK